MIAALSTVARRGMNGLSTVLYVATEVLFAVAVSIVLLLVLALMIGSTALLTIMPIMAADGHWLGWIGGALCGMLSASVAIQGIHTFYLFCIED